MKVVGESSELTPMKIVGESSEPAPIKVVGVSSEIGREESGPRADKGMHNEEPPAQLWRLFVDGSMTRNKSRAGIILETPVGFKHEYALEFQFKASNNGVEYEALIGGLQLARDIGVERVEVFSDSQLVVNQVNGSFEAKEPQLHSYQALSNAFMQRFKSASLSHIPQKENTNTDALARLATGGPGKGRKKARIEVLGKLSISKTISEIFMVEAGPREPTWMDPIIKFMKEGVCPEARRHARKLQSRCSRYTLMNGKLYRRGYNFLNLKCVTEEEGKVITREIHEGVCGNHSGSRSLAHKALRIGFFWPNMGAMADNMSARCRKCHLHANGIHSTSIALSILLSPWPFAQWGFDLIEILPTAPGQLKFGVQETIVTDNCTQFNNNHMIEFSKDMVAKMVFASMAHPQTNG
uniref:uncharacterized protein LOC101313915 n=1 Tax=Fragaria vesca subsp. vesca TaxID=101020 RepID=UPI0005C9E5B0|nr:PREDICTED: uncharacterized protein LOC101313915 [Fragaria vesca subsp. vesca]